MVNLLLRRRAIMRASEGGPGSDIPLDVNLLSSGENGYIQNRSLSPNSDTNSYSGNSYISNYLPVNQTDVFQTSSVKSYSGVHFYDENYTFISAVTSGANTGIRYLYKDGLSASTPRILIPEHAAFVRLTMSGSTMNSNHYYKRIQ